MWDVCSPFQARPIRPVISTRNGSNKTLLSSKTHGVNVPTFKTESSSRETTSCRTITHFQILRICVAAEGTCVAPAGTAWGR